MVAQGAILLPVHLRNLPDSLRWKEVIFKNTPAGSVLTTDTLLRQCYRRGYFSCALDPAHRTIAFKKWLLIPWCILRYTYVQPGTNHVVLRGKISNDSVLIALKRQRRHYQLAERQFHWLSEAIQ